MIEKVSLPAIKHEPSAWLASAAAALEESHLVACSDNPATRERFALEMAWFLRHVHQSQTVELPGAAIRDLPSFCRELERSLPGSGRIGFAFEGDQGIVAALRRRSPEMPSIDADIIKHRFYVWRDADTLLEADRELFARLVDAITGVAAEAEYADEDRLIIHRVLFTGGPALDAYADDTHSAFSRWLSENDEEPLWATISGLEAPPVARMRLA
jgi:hypothetical protein